MFSIIFSVMAGCGFHLRGVNDDTSHYFPALILDSSDPYSPLMHAIRHELRLNKITLVDDTREGIPSLRIIHATENRSTVSVFRDGKTAENQLKLVIEAQVLIPGQDIYSLNVSVLRSFFENPLNVLAKNAESEVLSQEMREQAAAQLVRKLSKIRVISNEKYHHSVSTLPAEN